MVLDPAKSSYPDYYYDQFRARTYACCFALEIDDHLWKKLRIRWHERECRRGLRLCLAARIPQRTDRVRFGQSLLAGRCLPLDLLYQLWHC